MRFLLLFLAVPAFAHADPGYTTYVSTVYQLSCERSVLLIFSKYGPPRSSSPEAQGRFAVTFCSKMIQSIEKAKAWNTIDSPAGAGCMDVVKSLIEIAPKQYPSKDALFAEFCYAVTKRDG